jgi:hypothetical protein
MPLLWVAVSDEAGRHSDRHNLESNIVALLSNARKPAIDPPSPDWLGHHAKSQRVRESGLWNVNFVADEYDPGVLTVLEYYVRATAPWNLSALTPH